jgi:hypothetical protein
MKAIMQYPLHGKEISDMIRRLAKVNNREIPSDSGTLGYATAQLTLLALKILGRDDSDVSGCAALPWLLYKLCGAPEGWTASPDPTSLSIPHPWPVKLQGLRSVLEGA